VNSFSGRGVCSFDYFLGGSHGVVGWGSPGAPKVLRVRGGLSTLSRVGLKERLRVGIGTVRA